MRKICFIELQPFPTTIGGGITHLNELSKELIRQGYDVSIITSPPADKQFSLDKGLEKLHLYHVGMTHKKLAETKRLRRLLYYPWRVLFELSFILGAAKVIKKEKFDIVNTQSLITTSLPCSLWGLPFAVTAHGVHHEGFIKLYKERNNFFVSVIASKFYRIIESFNAKKAKVIICLGQSTYDYYKKINSHCTIIPNGIDINRFSSSTAKRAKTIVSVGRFTEQKQLDKLIIAMDNLQDYTLEIIGLGPLEDQVKSLCNKRKNCKFLGYKSQEEIIPHLRKARFTILPSIFEGLPISMLEAMSCGVIPIATPVGDIPSVLKDGKTGFVLRDIKPKTIVETVRAAEKKDLSKLSTNCSNLIRDKYSWESLSNEFIRAWKLKN